MFFMRIAIIKLSAIGDIIHSMIVLQFIKEKYPESIIDWFVDTSLKGVLENNPHIDKIQTIRLREAKKKISLLLFFNEIIKLRKLKKYDLVIDLQNLIKSAIIARLIPSTETIGLDKYSSREGLASIFYTQKYSIDRSINVITRNTTIICKALSIKISEEDLINKKSFLFFNNTVDFDYLLNDKPNILLIPGASFDSKIYPAKCYAEIIKKVNGNFIVIWGDDSERIIAEEIKSMASKVLVSNKLTFNGLKSLISKVNLVIGGDTGPVHMSWGLGIPSITLFGSTPGYRNTRFTNINCIIESNSIVDPYKINKSDLSIKDIDPADVVKIAEKLLDDN